MSVFDFTTTDYTDKDFEAIKDRLISLVKTLYPDWPKDDVLSFGNMMLSAYAFVGDVINFYNDSNYREAYVPTASLLQSLLNIAEGLSVTLPLQEAATVDEEVSIPNGHPEDILIPENTIFATYGEDSVLFQTTSDFLIPSGTETYTIELEHSQTKEQIRQPTGASWWSTWLDEIPFLDIVSIVSNGFLWTQVETLVDSNPNDRHFEVVVNAAGRAKLRFGNGVLGKIPEEEMTILYKIGGGVVGNVEPNTITEIQTSVYDALGNSVSLTVTNPTRASGGNDKVSVDEARRLIPAGFTTQNRTVSRQDFVNNANLVSGVARSLMLTSNEDPGIEENMGHLIIVPEGGGFPSSSLKTDVLNAVTVDNPCTITFQVQVMNPKYKNIDIYAKIFRNSGVDESDVSSLIRSRLETFFAIRNANGDINEKVNFGGAYQNTEGETDSVLPYSDVYNEIRDTSGVRKLGTVNLNGVSGDVSLEPREFPLLGNVTLIDGDTGVSI